MIKVGASAAIFSAINFCQVSVIDIRDMMQAVKNINLSELMLDADSSECSGLFGLFSPVMSLWKKL
ncbi:hypothetical protein B9Z45_06495 [Limnohabitans sp. 2KL-17]|nr:hypothetical protein B9Z45_06495 [Limnohabitans sp. 2KL-17]